MTRILFAEQAFRRVLPRLGALAAQIECLVMDEAGTIRLDGREISAGDARPEGAWISNGILFSPMEQAYLDALLASANLKWVQSGGAGVDHRMFVQLAEKDVRLTTNHGQAVGMAEYVLWAVLNHLQFGNARSAEQAAHRWTKWRFREMSGMRWTIIGFGAIGEAVACRAKAFDAHVTGVRRQAGSSPFADVMATPDEMLDHLGDSDVVLLCAPQTPQTVNMVNADFLAAMKPGSLLVNVGRGSLIDDDALFAALSAGKPEHAVLDVFRTEPLPPDSWFWSHPRVTVTAHTSAMSTGAEARGEDLFVDNLARYLEGRPLLHEIPRPS